MYKILSYIEAKTGSAPVFNFASKQYGNITLNCALIKFGYWKAQFGVPVFENIIVDVLVNISYTPTGSSAQTISCTVQFIYKYESMNGDGHAGYSVLFRMPYLPNVTTGRLNNIVITGSSKSEFDTRFF